MVVAAGATVAAVAALAAVAAVAVVAVVAVLVAWAAGGPSFVTYATAGSIAAYTPDLGVILAVTALAAVTLDLRLLRCSLQCSYLAHMPGLCQPDGGTCTTMVVLSLRLHCSTSLERHDGGSCARCTCRGPTPSSPYNVSQLLRLHLLPAPLSHRCWITQPVCPCGCSFSSSSRPRSSSSSHYGSSAPAVQFNSFSAPSTPSPLSYGTSTGGTIVVDHQEGSAIVDFISLSILAVVLFAWVASLDNGRSAVRMYRSVMGGLQGDDWGPHGALVVGGGEC